ncbi:MAG: protein kinase [Fuerstiella sp.]
MPTSNPGDKAIFNAARVIDSPDDRRSYVHDACGDDTDQFHRVTALLRGFDRNSPFLESPVSELHRSLDLAHQLEVPAQIGPYKICEQIGEGGMGVVYLAQQIEPVRRKVALKVIKPGMDTRQVIARFEAERQALAMMNHPGIARILDAGMTSEGRPYFVMELARGIRIDKYCDDARLTLRDRLNLFIDVCSAIQHAHQKGIIHCDLKPSNILITLHDGAPVVKVIDFGIAKALNHDLTERTLFTHASELIGTPTYMSPEQIEMSVLDIDTRSDVYSLGVLLYKLLAGVTPFDKETLNSASYDEMRRIICENDPLRPSRRVNTRDNELISAISERRTTDTHTLSLSMQQELDWVVMKALEKDRSRRYESASSLAADLRRYLDGDVVHACPPSAAYRLQKYAKWHLILLSTGILLVETLLIATGISVSYAIQANAAKALSDDRAVELEKQSAELMTQRDRADEAAQLARENEAYARQLAYAADIRLAAEAWERGDVRQYTDLLDQYADPKDGEDLRGFEWWYLRQLGTVHYQTIVASVGGWYCLDHSQNGRYLAAGRRDGAMGIWDAHTYEQLAILNGHADSVGDIDFSPDGNRLASIGDDGLIRIWTVPEGKEFLSFPVSKGVAHGVRFALDGSVLVSCTEEPGIRIWDPESGQLIAELSTDGAEFYELAISPNGQTCAASGEDWKYGVWDLKTRSKLRGREAAYPFRCLDFPLDRPLLIAGMDNNSIEIRDHETAGTPIVATFMGHSDNIEDIAFHPHGTIMASCDRAGVIRSWNLDDSEGRIDENNYQGLPFVFRAHSSRVWALEYSPDGDRLVTAGNDGTIRAWTVRANAVEELPMTRPVAAGFTPDGHELVVAGKPGFTIWNRQTDESRSFGTEFQDLGRFLALSPDGNTLAADHADGAVRIWNIETGKVVQLISAHDGYLERVEFSPDSSLLITAGWEGTCKIWDVSTGDLQRVINVPPHCEDARFAPGGQTFAISTENDAMIYNTLSGQRLHLLRGHQNTAECVAFSPDGRWLATASHDRTIRLWDTTSGELEHIIPAHQNKIYSVAFSPDSQTIASGDKNGRVAFSHVSTGRFLFDKKVVPGRIDTVEFSPDGNALVIVDKGSKAVLLNTKHRFLTKEEPQI